MKTGILISAQECNCEPDGGAGPMGRGRGRAEGMVCRVAGH